MHSFYDVFLTKKELDLLNEMMSGKVVYAHPVAVERLISLNFVSGYKLNQTDEQSSYVIAPDGITYLEFREEQRKNLQEREKKERFRFWLPTIISIVAVVIAILK